ncbi:MAG: hypothetical protein OWT27_10940, partial [Firmicutes bacterium]|nr:hypothetical protein [Bacillota bacterium]
MKRAVPRIAAASALTLALCGASLAPASAQTILGQTSGHPFTILAAWNFPDGVNPLEPNSLTAAVGGMVNPPLAWVSRLDLHKAIPFIASRWKLNGNTLTIWVRRDAKWSNGQPVTAADVKASLEIS